MAGNPIGTRFRAMRRSSAFEVVFVVALAIGLAMAVQALAVKPYQIPSASMEPTLDVGERVLVNRFSTRLGGDPEVGDIVVFHPPLGAAPDEQERGERVPKCSVPSEERPGQACPAPGAVEADTTFIKRVVAGPGDRLKIIDGIPIVDGQRLEGDWRTVPCENDVGCKFPKALTVPPDTYFMMGDNRPASEDSRFWGPVPRRWIIGQAFLTYWPPQQVGGL